MQRVRGSGAPAGVRVVKARNILLSHLLLHDNAEGVRVSGPGGSDFTVRNSMIYNNDDDGIGGDEITDTILAENCTVYGNGDNGLDESDGTAFTATNTISVANGNQDFDIPAGTQLANLSSDGTATGPGSLPLRTPTDNPNPGPGDWVILASLIIGSEDLHRRRDRERRH